MLGLPLDSKGQLSLVCTVWYVDPPKMCQLQGFHEILHAENVKGVLERQWSRKKSYVMKWKQ